MSNTDWYGVVPSTWSISRLKNILIERNESNNPIKTDFILSLTNDRGVIPYSEKGAVGNNSKEDITGYKLAYPGDLVLNSMNVVIGSVGISNYFGCVSPVYYMLRPRSEYDSIEFFNYLFQTTELQSALKGYGNGILEIRMRIAMSKLNTFLLPKPDYRVQTKIVQKIKESEVKIDQLINNQKKQIEKLKEYKQSLISEVVTKGLDPNVEFKDSGIEIIDKIPKDWGIIKMKYLGESRNGLTYNPSDMVDDGEGILVLRSSNVRDGKLIFDDNVYLKMQIKEDLMLKNGDILICSRNGSRDLIGKNAIIENVGLCSFGAFMMVFRVSKANPKYIKYILDSFIFNYYLGTYLTATINQLTLSNFNNMKVIYTTNSDEQEKIISYLDEKCQKIDRLIELKAKKLLNLEEFKKSLIYEYVTGKKEVS